MKTIVSIENESFFCLKQLTYLKFESNKMTFVDN
jgi:hypothetical protein